MKMECRCVADVRIIEVSFNMDCSLRRLLGSGLEFRRSSFDPFLVCDVLCVWNNAFMVAPKAGLHIKNPVEFIFALDAS